MGVLLRRLRALRQRMPARPLGAYFALLFLLVVLGAAGAALYVDRQASADARAGALRDATHSAEIAAAQLGEFVALLKETTAQLAANAQIASTFNGSAAGCTLTFQGIAGPDRGHLDLIRPDGTVACSSRPITDAARETGYARSAWLDDALGKPLFIAPTVDDLGGAPVAVSTSPVPGRIGVVAAFADLGAVGQSLETLYGGGRPTLFVLTSQDNRTIVSHSLESERWIGERIPADAFDRGPEHTDLSGTDRLFATAPVPGVAWNVHVGEESSAVLASVERLRNRQLQLILAGLAFFLLAAAITYRKVALPISRLSVAVRASGATDSRPAVPVSGPAEVRTLAEDVNSLIGSVSTELAERRRAEAAARESEQRYRLLFESNPNPMWVYDIDTLVFLAVNDAAVEAYGWSREEFLEMTIDEIRPADEVPRLRAAVSESGGGLTHAGVWRHRRKDGSELDAAVTSHDHHFDGHLARVAMAVDVTERIRADEALRRSEARYRDLFENASDLISTVDLDGRITAVNEAFVRAMGWDRDDLIGSNLEEHIPPESHAIVAEARQRKLAGAGATIYEHALLARDGRRIQVEVSSRLIEEDGRAVGTEAICRDVTERRRLEEELRQAQRLEGIGRLAGGIAHDFNNLLTVISGYTETLLIERDAGSEPELEQIAAAAERAALLTRQLLAFSRRQVLQPRIVRVNEVIEGLAPMLERVIGEDVELVTTLAPGGGLVLADSTQLEQILLNLTVNARDAMPSGGRLTIAATEVDLDDEYVAHHGESEAGPHVMLSVTDTGTGMDAATLAQAFEPFFTTKPVGTGTGLGLATVYGIVKQSGGSLWVYSELGEGTTFKVYLPRSEGTIVEEVLRPVVSLGASGSETILLAEDEASLRRLTATILERHGYEVISAETPAEALRIVESQERPIDLLLTDLIMPGLSGGELARKVTAIAPGIRVLFMSGYADSSIGRTGGHDPATPFLEKPFSAGDLTQKVHEALHPAA